MATIAATQIARPITPATNSDRKRVRELKITTDEISQSVKEWTRTEASERLTSRLGIAKKAVRIESGLQQADHWLDLTESSVQFVQQALVAGNSLGGPGQFDAADPLLEELAALRKQIKEVTELAQRIGEQSKEDGLVEDRIDELAKLALRVVATLSSINSRLENLGGRLTEVQTHT